MDNILTLNKINKSDVDEVGYKAIDIAELHVKKLNVPICFVIKTSLFDDFISSNNLNSQINKIISESDFSNDESLEAAYTKIKELFDNTELSAAAQDELMEAYETLAIDIDHLDIAKLVTTIDKPFLTIIGSPNYVDDSENNVGIFHNVKGKPALFRAIKYCWSSLYTPSALKYRKKEDITTEEKMGVIVQRMVESDVSAQTFSDKTNIIVKTFYGYQDYGEEFEKDISIFDKDTLAVKNAKVNNQECFFVRDMRDNSLVKKDLREKGSVQKLNDKEVEELARITKKVEGLIEKPIKLFISISKNKIYILFVNRILIKEEEEEVTEEAIIETPVPETNVEKNISEETPPETDSIELSDDLSALDEIEAHEQKESIVVEPVREEITKQTEETSSWTEDASSKVEEEVQAKPEEGLPEVKVDSEPEPEVVEQEEESSWAEPVNKEPEVEEETTPEIHEEKTGESDDFIFANFEEPKEKEETPEEKVSDIPIPKPEEETEINVTESNNSEVEETKQTEEPIFKEKNELDEAVEMTKKIVLKSDQAIYNALKKKHETVLGSMPSSFEEAIKGLQEESVTIPFLEEIKNIHETKLKVEMGDEIEIEESSMALRTAKNFLGMFS